MTERDSTGAAKRRRDRRLRMHWRHELLSLRMALAECQHHSAQRPKMARAGEEVRVLPHGEVPEQPPLQLELFGLSMKSPAVPGHPVWVSRGDHRSGSSRTPWSSMLTSCPWFRSWTFLWRRREGAGGGPADLDKPSSEQAIVVPKKSKSSRRCFVLEFCFVPMEHQTAEQLVEVPSTVSFSSLQRTAEQSVDIPGTGRRPGSGGGLQGLRPGQDSTALTLQFLVIVAVGLGLQGFSQEQNSAAFRGAEHVDIPVPKGRGGGGLHGLRPGQSSSASPSMDRSYVADGAFDGLFALFQE